MSSVLVTKLGRSVLSCSWVGRIEKAIKKLQGVDNNRRELQPANREKQRLLRQLHKRENVCLDLPRRSNKGFTSFELCIIAPYVGSFSLFKKRFLCIIERVERNQKHTAPISLPGRSIPSQECAKLIRRNAAQAHLTNASVTKVWQQQQQHQFS